MLVGSPFDDAAVGRAARDRPDVISLRLKSVRGGAPVLFTATLHDATAPCLSTGEPLLSRDSALAARELTETLERLPERPSRVVYFPLVAGGGDSSRVLEAAGLRSWPRLPAPQICAESLEAGLARRAEQRLGKRAPRRLRRFRKHDPVLRTCRSSEAMAHVRRIESRSWKAALRQDMLAKNQTWIYAALSRSPNARVRVAFLDHEPVAYRFDYLLDGILYCLKWSYDEAFRSLSPGFYLMTEDLSECWAGAGVLRVDLCGAIDSLKAAIADEGPGLARCDFAYSAESALVGELREERLAHDRRIMETYRRGVGIRYAYH